MIKLRRLRSKNVILIQWKMSHIMGQRLHIFGHVNSTFHYKIKFRKTEVNCILKIVYLHLRENIEAAQMIFCVVFQLRFKICSNINDKDEWDHLHIPNYLRNKWHTQNRFSGRTFIECCQFKIQTVGEKPNFSLVSNCGCVLVEKTNNFFHFLSQLCCLYIFPVPENNFHFLRKC